MSLLNTISDYTDIIAISIGLNLAYVIITNYTLKGNDNKASFFDILSLYVDSAISRIVKRKSKKLITLKNLQLKLEYYLASKSSNNSEKKAIVKNIDDELKNIDTSVNDLIENKKIKVKRAIRAKYYSHISLLLATYGIFILFLSPLEKRIFLSFNSILVYLNFITFFCVIHSIIWEFQTLYIKIKKLSILNTIICDLSNLLAPRFRNIIYSQFIFIIALIIAIYCKYFNTYVALKFPFFYRNALVFATVLLFSNFIFYTIFCFIRVEIVVSRFKRKLKALDISNKVITYNGLLAPILKDLENDPLVVVSEIVLTQK